MHSLYSNITSTYPSTIFVPTVDEALIELSIAGEMNPGPWVKHSENVGIAARICMTHSYLLMKEQFGYEPETLEEKEIKKYIVGCGEADEYDWLIQMCDALAIDYGFVILEKRFVVNFF